MKFPKPVRVGLVHGFFLKKGRVPAPPQYKKKRKKKSLNLYSFILAASSLLLLSLSLSLCSVSISNNLTHARLSRKLYPSSESSQVFTYLLRVGVKLEQPISLVFSLFHSLFRSLFWFNWFGFVSLREMEGNDGSRADNFYTTRENDTNTTRKNR